MDHPPLVRKVQRALAGHAAAGDVVVAVSGGPDSVALLIALADLQRAGAVGPLVAAHLNHRLRGAESDADEDFVRELSSVLGPPTAIRFCSERIDVAARVAELGRNLEEVARQTRYDWLTDVARAGGAGWVATGHTADDQAETVLHHLLRGTGLRGLRGIARRRALAADVQLVRPLLDVTRAEVLEHLEAVKQPFRTDASNQDPRFTRNRIRAELLPLLAREYNPAAVEILCRLALQADEALEEEQARAAALLAAAERPRAAACLVFDRGVLGAARRHVIREVFRLVWVREGWPLGEMGFEDWDRLAAVVCGEITAVDLPGGVHARGRERVVQVRRGS